jgi:hypothetical protein
MSDYIVTDTELTSVADAIRAKSGGNTSLAFPGGFVSEIESIPVGGEWTTDGIATGTQPSGDLVITSNYIEQGAFSHRNSVTSIRSTTVTATYTGALMYCGGVQTVFLPNVTTNRMDTLSYCSMLETAVIGTLAGYGYTFRYDTKLEAVDILNGSLGSNTFNHCPALSKLILRSNTIQALGSTNAFTTDTPFASGGAGGTIYIKKVLYDHLGDGSALDYKAATNWSTIDGYGTITWAQIEGSQYENYYVDGTPIT